MRCIIFGGETPFISIMPYYHTHYLSKTERDIIRNDNCYYYINYINYSYYVDQCNINICPIVFASIYPIHVVLSTVLLGPGLRSGSLPWSLLTLVQDLKTALKVFLKNIELNF